MKRQPIVIRSRAKAIALEAAPVQEGRWIAIIHLLVTLLLLFAITGCIPRSDGEPVDFGPRANVADINEALSKPIEHMDPLNIKMGEFRAIEQTQEIIGMSGQALLAAQGVTITSREDQGDKIMFTAVITDVSYKNDGTFEKVSREGPVCVSKVAGACGEETVPSPGSMVAKAFSSPVVYIENTVKALVSNITFHRLRLSTVTEPVPREVAARPNCGGVVDCKMQVYNVGFDQVTWENGKGTRIRVDVKLSPSVPYLSNQLQACFTGLAPVGKTSDVIVKQCSTVYDFRFESP